MTHLPGLLAEISTFIARDSAVATQFDPVVNCSFRFRPDFTCKGAL